VKARNPVKREMLKDEVLVIQGRRIGKRKKMDHAPRFLGHCLFLETKAEGERKHEKGERIIQTSPGDVKRLFTHTFLVFHIRSFYPGYLLSLPHHHYYHLGSPFPFSYFSSLHSQTFSDSTNLKSNKTSIIIHPVQNVWRSLKIRHLALLKMLFLRAFTSSSVFLPAGNVSCLLVRFSQKR